MIFVTNQIKHLSRSEAQGMIASPFVYLSICDFLVPVTVSLCSQLKIKEAVKNVNNVFLLWRILSELTLWVFIEHIEA